MFDLLSEFHFVLIIDIFEIAFLVDLVLDFSYDYGHFVGDDVFVLAVGDFAGLVLFIVELGFHVPGFVVADFAEDGLVLTQVEKASVDLHQVFSEGGLADE